MMLTDELVERQSYEAHKRRILSRFSEAQRRWEGETGARLLVSQRSPYFSYTRDDLAQSKGAA
jgi:hypothetical protein